MKIDVCRRRQTSILKIDVCRRRQTSIFIKKPRDLSKFSKLAYLDLIVSLPSQSYKQKIQIIRQIPLHKKQNKSSPTA